MPVEVDWQVGPPLRAAAAVGAAVEAALDHGGRAGLQERWIRARPGANTQRM